MNLKTTRGSKWEIVISWMLVGLLLLFIVWSSAQNTGFSEVLSVTALKFSYFIVRHWKIALIVLIGLVVLALLVWLSRRQFSRKKAGQFLLGFGLLSLLLIAVLLFVVRPLILNSPIVHYNFWTIHLIFRKYAHFFIFLALGFLVKNALAVSGIRGWRGFLLAILFCLLIGIFDEIHQIFVPGRTPLVMDVIIDGLGSFLGVLIYQPIDFLSGSRTPWQAFWNL